MGARLWLVSVMVALGLAGCVGSQATQCGDLLCPQGHACVNGACADPLTVRACAGLNEDDRCTIAELGTGVCVSGLCKLGLCGDGVINGIDACDGADLGGKTCLDFGSTDQAGLACAADCSYDVSQCVARCGDGVKDSAEQCDGADFGGATCITQGFYGGAIACTDTCQLNLGGCRERCGDGVRNGLEQCDGQDFEATTCANRGFPGDVSQLICDANCALSASSCLCGVERCAPPTPLCVQNNGAFTCEANP